MPHVLIVDDDMDMLNLLRTMLQMRGYDVTVTANPFEAIALAEKKPPDIILLDYMMPLKDGMVLCHEMRAHSMLAHQPIVFLTAYGSPNLQEQVLAAGGTMLLKKPITVKKLAIAMAELKHMVLA